MLIKYVDVMGEQGGSLWRGDLDEVRRTMMASKKGWMTVRCWSNTRDEMNVHFFCGLLFDCTSRVDRSHRLQRGTLDDAWAKKGPLGSLHQISRRIAQRSRKNFQQVHLPQSLEGLKDSTGKKTGYEKAKFAIQKKNGIRPQSKDQPEWVNQTGFAGDARVGHSRRLRRSIRRGGISYSTPHGVTNSG